MQEQQIASSTTNFTFEVIDGRVEIVWHDELPLELRIRHIENAIRMWEKHQDKLADQIHKWRQTSGDISRWTTYYDNSHSRIEAWKRLLNALKEKAKCTSQK